MPASPQLENGYVKISNELLEALCKTRTSGESRQVLDCIIRKTYGFNKKSDLISLSQFCEATLMPKAAVCRAIRMLRTRKIIVTRPTGFITEYRVNKDYCDWEKYEPYDRKKILKRDKYTCHICLTVFKEENLEVDHVIPLWLNGSNKEENLKACCSKCNQKKGAERLRYMGVKNDTVSELPQYQKSSKRVAKLPLNPVSELPQTKDITSKDTIQKTGEITPFKNAKYFFKGIQDLVQKIDTEESQATRSFLQALESKHPQAGKGAIWREVKKFEAYWTEMNQSGTKQRWQLQEAFQVDRRLVTWFGKVKEFQEPDKNINTKPKRNIIR